MVERKSKRQVEDGRSILEKAHDTKRKWNEAIPAGKNKHKPSHISFCDLSTTASVMGLVGKDGNPISNDLVRKIADIEGLCR